MTRPLIVCDVDEVILGFAEGFERFIAKRGLRLVRRSYALSGNIIHIETGDQISDADVKALIHQFHERDVHTLPAVPGASKALSALSTHAQIKFLTNIHERHVRPRTAHLKRIGLDYPVIANQGSKGPALERLAREHRCIHLDAPIVFLDDSSAHLDAARAAVPDIFLVHFIADDGFRAVSTKPKHAHLLTGDWKIAQSFIHDALTAHKKNNRRKQSS